MTTDLRIIQSKTGIWDFNLNSNGDLENGDFFDSSITYAILGERRASESEVLISENRRGWIGNEGKDFENGSKIWLFEQARLTRSILNDIQSAALDALEYFVEDGIATRITATAFLQNGSAVLSINIFVSPSKVETRFFVLWSNTGLR